MKLIPPLLEHPDHDRLFKELITLLFLEFLELFAPQIAVQLNPDSIEFVDKEIFSEILPSKEYEVDVLVRVRIAGEERFVLIHIENQSKKQGGFGGRMFDYFAVIRARFGLRVYPIAVLSYDRPRKAERPVYTETEFGMEVVRYQFQAIQLNRLRWQDYVGHANPVAIALMAKMNVAPEDHAVVRREFYRLFSTGKWNLKQLRIIDQFMRSYLKLTTAQYRQIRREMEAKMPSETKKTYAVFMDDVETAAFERGIGQGIERGLEQGIERGLEQGIEQGVHSGALNLTLRILQHRFGALDALLQKRLSALPTEKLEALGLALYDLSGTAQLKGWLDANA